MTSKLRRLATGLISALALLLLAVPPAAASSMSLTGACVNDPTFDGARVCQGPTRIHVEPDLGCGVNGYGFGETYRVQDLPPAGGVGPVATHVSANEWVISIANADTWFITFEVELECLLGFETLQLSWYQRN